MLLGTVVPCHGGCSPSRRGQGVPRGHECDVWDPEGSSLSFLKSALIPQLVKTDYSSSNGDFSLHLLLIPSPPALRGHSAR